jgi:hypothetical protein
MTGNDDISATSGGMYHPILVTKYAEQVFLEAMQWIEEYNRRHPEDRLSMSGGLLRLAKLGLEAKKEAK